MGKTFSRNPNDENYRGNMRKQRKQEKQERKNRHRHDAVLDSNMEPEDGYGEHSNNFRPRRNDW